MTMNDKSCVCLFSSNTDTSQPVKLQSLRPSWKCHYDFNSVKTATCFPIMTSLGCLTCWQGWRETRRLLAALGEAEKAIPVPWAVCLSTHTARPLGKADASHQPVGQSSVKVEQLFLVGRNGQTVKKLML